MRFIVLLFLLAASLADAANTNRHVVVVVWDGMRPDFVSESNTPTLHALAQRGVVFQSNHCVYLSSTEVNGTALATGAYPERSGVIGNREFRPDIDPNKPIDTQSLDAIRKGDARENYLGMPTVAEILRRQGYRTAIAGSKPVVLLHDRAARAEDSPGVVVFEGRALPAGILDGIVGRLGPFPDSGDTKVERDLWTTRALIGPLWDKGVPAFSLLWLAEPDSSQHATGAGSPRSLAAIRASDNALAGVIEALKAKGVYDRTDIFVVSDHAFSTIDGHVNVGARLRENGFNASREFKTRPARGDVMVVGLGGSTLLYVAEHDGKTVDRLVRFLQTEDYPGVILTRRRVKGAFRLSEAMINSAHAPDVVISMRWSSATNAYGAPGVVIAEGQSSSSAAPSAKGTHVSLSPFDLHNTLIAAGPDFRQGMVSRTPSGNVDVAPTILHLLGIKPPKRMDGRVLFEALAGEGKSPVVEQRRSELSVKTSGGTWTQHLSVRIVNGVRYLEEGNGRFTPLP